MTEAKTQFETLKAAWLNNPLGRKEFQGWVCKYQRRESETTWFDNDGKTKTRARPKGADGKGLRHAFAQNTTPMSPISPS